MDTLDLRLGNPEFLHTYWLDKETPAYKDTLDKMKYQPLNGMSALHSAIKEVHNKVGNAVVDGKFIIVGAGITQILAAALYANKKFGAQFAYAKPPFFFRFPGISEIAGLEFKSDFPENPVDVGKWVEIVTSPTNPQNLRQPPHFYSPMRVYDLCYNWPQYKGVIEMNEDIMIFGLSKATGHASTRIGWAIVEHEEIAAMMARYIEFSSGTPSAECQERATYILRSQTMEAGARDDDQTVFEYGADILTARWQEIYALAPKDFIFLNYSGMFAWVLVPDQVAAKYFEAVSLLGVSGEQLGSDEHHIRFNIGCSEQVFRKFILRLKSLERPYAPTGTM